MPTRVFQLVASLYISYNSLKDAIRNGHVSKMIFDYTTNIQQCTDMSDMGLRGKG